MQEEFIVMVQDLPIFKKYFVYKSLICIDKYWIFSWAMNHIRERRNIVIRAFRAFACKVGDVFSFHLQVFHWFIAPHSRTYFQGHSPRENPTPLPLRLCRRLDARKCIYTTLSHSPSLYLVFSPANYGVMLYILYHFCIGELSTTEDTAEIGSIFKPAERHEQIMKHTIYPVYITSASLVG
jgi:hypothetical protein